MSATPDSDNAGMTPKATLAWTGGLAIIWLVVAVSRDHTTLHLGPLLVPLVPLLVARSEPFARKVTGGAALMGLAVIGILEASGHLEGPAIAPFTSAIVESIALLGIGTMIGVIGTRISRRDGSGGSGMLDVPESFGGNL